MKLVCTRLRRDLFLRDCLRSPATYAGGNPLRHWAAWHRGFSSVQSVYHEITAANTGDFFPDIDRYLFTIRTNRHVWPILHDKLIFDSFMRGRLPIATAAGCFVSGSFIPTDPQTDYATILQRVESGERFVVKPAQGGKGYGVQQLHRNGDAIHLGAATAPIDKVNSLWQGLDYHLLVPFKQPQQSLARLYPDSVNTLRITVFKNANRPARLFSPLLRIGTARSAPMDNFSQGGMLAAIDPESGRTVAACYRDDQFRRQVVERHPDSNAELLGITIPGWPDIRDTLLAFHDQHPCFDFVGWDVLVGETEWWVIEGNHNPDLDLPFSFTTRRTHPELDEFMRGLRKETT